MRRWVLAGIMVLLGGPAPAQQPVPEKPRLLISTDIGGTDPDDNQSMAHFLMYSNRFTTEGLVSSPSYGKGSKQELLRMIDLYEKDLPALQKNEKGYPSPAALRTVCKQGRQGPAPYAGYRTATEGSDWIIQCARKKSPRSLWILVWGGLDDLAQALHDAPDIRTKIKVYWIGGPNKKWSANSYAYIAANFPDLWFIECNGSYNGFFSRNNTVEKLTNTNYYDNYIKGAGALGKDFKNYYKGHIKMGDTPSLLYLMDGAPGNPFKESWGGSFTKIMHSPRTIFNRNTTIADTVTIYSVLEFHFKGPKTNVGSNKPCFTMTVQAGIGEQQWEGFYLGDGAYVVRYCPKQSEVLTYKITSAIPEFPEQSGQLVVDNTWPGKGGPADYRLGDNWYSDRAGSNLFDEGWQGAKTVSKWRNDALLDWAKRWARLQ
ncbi:hypothetical protein NIASO_18685 [Niabella soli DSM 19437]|uniref:Uncharacterized protein n=1 Tax=Niabella soli DSM 19437 TaxID=929713 RepID=W0F0S7_9BACT|nr:hypothetical protein NIASO_18685 [Niabella soli DSM 19437]